MPSSMIHLFVAKKVSPNAKIDFYIGNIAPDTVKERDKKIVTHLRNAPDKESALKELALKIKGNDYLKGYLLHLFVDWKWEETLLADFAEKEGEGWYSKYFDEVCKMASYYFHITEWSDELFEQMELCDDYDFVETEFLTKEAVKHRIQGQRKWSVENKIGPSDVFTPAVIDKFVNDTAADFNKWFSLLIN